MPTSISNPRDLRLQLLGTQLYVERRLAADLLPRLADAVEDDETRTLLRRQTDDAAAAAARIEADFRRDDAAPSANRADEVDGLVARWERVAANVKTPGLVARLALDTALRAERLRGGPLVEELADRLERTPA